MIVQHFLLLALLIAICSVGSVVMRLGANVSTSISLHATKHRTAFLVMACGITLSLVSAGLFYFSWFQQAHSLNVWSSFVFAVILISLFIAAWVPDVEGAKRFIHRNLAYIAVFAMPIFLVLLLPKLPLWLQVIDGIVIASQAGMTYLLLFVKAAYKYFLPLQAVYLGGFFVVLLSATYFGVH